MEVRKTAKMPKATQKRIHANLRKGQLEKYGYAMHLPDEERHEALKRAIAATNPTQVFREINLLEVFNRNNHPDLVQIAIKDKEWIAKNYGV
ncbi:MAG TPA: hypothetical protein VMS95_06120 [Candidatus Krumholzibacteriaceae bacterium]|jgi:chemotaxis methyl-accepting protein methylase|nr:hypothetical protein [Candidatus Krumholzibacteriaceae bacterium]